MRSKESATITGNETWVADSIDFNIANSVLAGGALEIVPVETNGRTFDKDNTRPIKRIKKTQSKTGKDKIESREQDKRVRV